MAAAEPREFHARKTLVVALVLVGFIVYSYTRPGSAPGHARWSGETMGTTYSVSLADNPLSARALHALRNEIDAYLAEINRQMSTYLPDSEISAFNRSTSTQPITVAPEFAEVTRFAVELARRSGGAFDPTVGPLVDLWGFGASDQNNTPPDDSSIQAARQQAGHMHVSALSPTELQKRLPGIQLDLGAVAKGFAVDGIANLVMEHGVSNLFVEIGGDGVAFGHNRSGESWRIGIDRPELGALPGQALQAILQLENIAVATSGDYRNFRVNKDGERFSHILDPRMGRPVQHRLAGVSVVATDCMTADGLATALFVMGEEEGLKWIETYPGAEALFLVRQEDGGFREVQSSGLAERAPIESVPAP